MKNSIIVLLVITILSMSCTHEEVKPLEGKGTILLNASVSVEINSLKAAIVVDDFIVTITENTTGDVKYSNTVAASADPIELDAGIYTVSVASEPYLAPGFDQPEYGAVRNDVVMVAEQTTTVSLECRQTNSGLRLSYHQNMVDYCLQKGYAYHAAVTNSIGELYYNNDETRYGYFNPGEVTVSVVMNSITYRRVFALTAGDLKTIVVNVVPLPEDPTLLTLSISGDNGTIDRDDDFDITDGEVVRQVAWQDIFTGLSGNSISTSGSNSSLASRSGYAVLTSVYQAGDAIRLGTTSLSGIIQLNPLDLTANGGSFVVELQVKGWISGTGTLGGTLQVSCGAQTETVSYQASDNLTTYQTIRFSMNSGSEDAAVVISSTNSSRRVFIHSLRVLN
ncbi:MAG: DUF4493 domain-containing protein [Breznakibacter sp.]